MKMRFLRALLASTTITFSLTLKLLAADANEVNAHYRSYHTAGKAVVEAAVSKKIDPSDIEKRVQTMVTDAAWFAKEYAKAHPAGQKLLQTVIDHIPAMQKLSYEDLEKDWHDLGYFGKPGNDPGVNLKDEDNEHLTDPIHCIVHPLLVLKAAQKFAAAKNEDSLKQIKEEMEEGLEQMEKTKAALAKK